MVYTPKNCTVSQFHLLFIFNILNIHTASLLNISLFSTCTMPSLSLIPLHLALSPPFIISLLPLQNIYLHSFHSRVSQISLIAFSYSRSLFSIMSSFTHIHLPLWSLFILFPRLSSQPQYGAFFPSTASLYSSLNQTIPFPLFPQSPNATDLHNYCIYYLLTYFPHILHL